MNTSMNTSTSKVMICGLLFVLTLISGILLSNSGKPYSTGIFTVHKLVAVGSIILLGVSLYGLARVVDVRALYLIIFAITGLLLVALIVSGALLSLVDGALLTLEEPMLQAVLRTHQSMPLLAVSASIISVYLLVSSKS